MSRPSHRLPAGLLDALVNLENTARQDEYARAEHLRAGGADPSGLGYVRAVAETGAERDRVALLILEALEAARGGAS